MMDMDIRGGGMGGGIGGMDMHIVLNYVSL